MLDIKEKIAYYSQELISRKLQWKYLPNKRECKILRIDSSMCFIQYFVTSGTYQLTGKMGFRVPNKRKKGTIHDCINYLKGFEANNLEEWNKYKKDKHLSEVRTKRDKKYNSTTKANILYKLKKAYELYNKGGFSLSKSARLAECDYELLKRYVAGDFKESELLKV